ncbi:MAG: YraN family protein [Paramuribaculum sp.]|nr:YraN family protein [Paramuribaculum sp.]
MALHNDLGKWGEEVAYEYFVKKGYGVIGRNVRMGRSSNELDLILTKGTRIIFVEVKTRKTDAVDPLLSITPEKERRIIRAAESYLRQTRSMLDPQFDLFIVIGNPSSDYRVEHHKDVFRPPLHSGGSRW